MSKDKGSKNHKKAPADKSAGKSKSESDYKSEGKSKEPALDTFTPKNSSKSGGNNKS